MRVCLVITELAPGGAERALVHLACGLQDRNIDVFVVSLKPLPSEERGELVRQLEKGGIHATSLEIKTALGFLRARSRLRSLLDDFQPDLVQSFLHHANILSAICHRSSDPWKLVAGYRVADPRRWRMMLEKYYKKRWDHFTCVSEEVSTDLVARMHLAAEHVTTIPNGVEIDKFKNATPLAPALLPRDEGRRLLGIISRLHPQKGLVPLMAHLPGLLGQLPQHDLVIVGEGPQRQAIERELAKHELQRRVSLAGWVEDIPGFLASIDLLLLPSRWEGMPNVVLEAMAAAIPVVSFRVQGITALLGQSSSWQVTEPGDYAGFCQKIIGIATAPAQASELGNSNAVQIANFSIPAMVDRYNQLYDHLCS